MPAAIPFVVKAATVGAKIASVASSVKGAVDSFKGAKSSAKAQKTAIKSQGDITKDQYDFYRDYYRPVEQRVTTDALGGIDPNYAATRAGIDVQQASARGTDIMERNLSRLGVDASSQRFQETLADMQIAQAAAEAGARTKARGSAIRQNIQRRFDVAALGRGIPSQSAAGMASIAAQHGQQAAASGQASGDFARLAMQAPTMVSDFANQFRGGTKSGGGGGGGGSATSNFNSNVGSLGQTAVPGSGFESRFL